MALFSNANRRTFLGVASAAFVTATSAARSADDTSEGLVDAHVHVWTSDVAKYPLAEGFQAADMKPASFTPEELFAHCRPQGVKRVVLIQMSFYKFDNRYMLDAIAGHPGVFSGVAIVDHEQAGLLDTMKRLAKGGVRGFRLYADKEKVQGWDSSSGMKAMWTHAADENLAVCLLADPDALPGIQAYRERLPKTPLVIDHFARIGMRGPIDSADLDRLCRFAEKPATYIKTSAFYALGAKRAPYLDLGPMVRRLREAFGTSRLMWASDCPFQVVEGHNYADSVALIRDRLDFLTPEDKSWMLRKTAEKVYFS